MVDYIIVSPAYGRDYKNKSDAVQSWRAGHDFVLESIVPFDKSHGRYCSNRNFPAGTKVEIRYKKKRSFYIITN